MKRGAKVQISQLNPDASSNSSGSEEERQPVQKKGPRVISMPTRRTQESGTIQNPFAKTQPPPSTKAATSQPLPNQAQTHSIASREEGLKHRDEILKEIETLNTKFAAAVQASFERDARTDFTSLFPQYTKYRGDIQQRFGILKETMGKLSVPTREVEMTMMPSPPKTQTTNNSFALSKPPVALDIGNHGSHVAAAASSFNGSNPEQKTQTFSQPSAPKVEEPKPFAFSTSLKPEEPKPFAVSASFKPEEPKSFSFGTPKQEDISSFSFGAPKPEGAKPFAFNAATSEESKPFTSSAPKAEEPKPFAFNNASKPEVSQPFTPLTLPEESKPFAFNAPNLEEPTTFSFSTAKPEDSKPVLFNASKPEDSKPFAYGATNHEESKTFSFNAAKSENSASIAFSAPKPEDTTPFTVGQSTTATTESAKPVFTFINSRPASTNNAESSSNMTFTFGQPAAATTTENTQKPFSFSTSSNNSLPTFSFGQPASTSSTAATSATPSFSFGQTNTTSAAPSFSFGPTTSTTNATSAKPSFSFGQASTSAPTFSFGPTASTTTTTAPSFSFGPTTSTTTNPDDASDDDDEAPPTLPEEPVNPELVQKGQGEEDEVTQWQARSKLFRFEGGGWRDVGIGLAKINQSQQDQGKRRLLIRAEGTGKVLLNVDVRGVVCNKPERPTELILITSHDAAKYLLRCKETLAPLAEILKQQSS